MPRGIFLNGDFRPGSEGDTFDVRNPADGSVLATVASASEKDAREALDAACAVQDRWSATPSRERSEILRRAFDLINEHAEDLAAVQTLELGRTLADSRAEVSYGAEFFRWFSEEAVRVTGDYRHNPAGSARVIVHHKPVGPSLAITPWNFPLAMGTRKLGPALAAGCTMLLKPASKTPLTMLYLARLLKEAGVPDGVVAVLPTKHSAHVSALLADPRLRKLTFTGSTAVGQQLGAEAAKRSLRVSLELGGNAPFIVCSDADLNKAVEAVKTAKMRGAGQVCIAANRFLVHSSLAAEFSERIAGLMASHTVGPGWCDGVDYGPLSGPDQVDTVRTLVADAVERGARRLVGGALPEDLADGGYYYPATVLTDVPKDAKIRSEEIFGPVVAITTFDSDEEAIRLANQTPFGLAAYLFSENLERSFGIAERLEAGMVAVNKGALSDPAAPFGGIKESGLGREGGFEGIYEYLEPTFFSLPL